MQCRREIQLVYKIYIYFYRLYWYFYRLYWYCYVVSQRDTICGLSQPQFIVPEGQNIWEVTERLSLAFGHHNLLCLKVITFEKSQRGYLWPLATTVHCTRRPQHLRSHREAIYGPWPPQFIVPEGHNIWEVTERLFVAFAHHSSLCLKATAFEKSQRLFVALGHHTSLCPKATIFEKSQRGYLWSLLTTVHCARMSQHLRSHKEAICGLCPPQLIVPEGHNIWEVTESLFEAFAHRSSLWPKATIFEKSQRGYFWPLPTTVHLWYMLQFVSFAYHSSLCLKARVVKLSSSPPSPTPPPTTSISTAGYVKCCDAFDWCICCQIVRPIGFLECVHKCKLRPTLDFKADVRRNVHCAPGGNSEISQDCVF